MTPVKRGFASASGVFFVKEGDRYASYDRDSTL